MTFTTKIELSLRIYVRQIEDIKLKFDDFKSQLRQNYDKSVSFGDFNDIYWPVLPENAQKMSEKGFFTIKKGDTTCILIRELPIIIEIPESQAVYAEQEIESLITVHGNVFSNVRIVMDYITEVTAI